MSIAENFEDCLPKSLIEDLDDISCPDDFKVFQKRKSSSTQDSFSPSLKSQKEKLTDSFNDSEESILRAQYCFTITKEEIWMILVDQKATLNLQKAIKDFSSEDIAPILEEIKGSIWKMMIHRNGNYLCKDLFKICDSNQRLSILNEISPYFEIISNNEFGTHPIQSLIENSNTQEEITLIINMVSNKKTVLKLSQNSNGSFVIQKMITSIPENLRVDFDNILVNCFATLAINMYGVCILKKFISYCQSKALVTNILAVIVQSFVLISENQYGNYLVQSVLEEWWSHPEVIGFKEYVLQQFYHLAINQYGSHIAETFINMFSIEERCCLIQHLQQNGCFYYLINEKYGMFVMNKLVNSIQRLVRSKKQLY